MNKEYNIAIIGQPNCGKTTLFNKLTGSYQHVGNWPGVTVEKKEGKITFENINLKFIDLPGVYSLSSYSLEEKITRDFLINQTPDLVINIVDATNLERQLFLTIQLLFLRIPTVIVLNMMDEVESKGFKIDIERLSKLLEVPIIPIVARESKGIIPLLKKIIELIKISPYRPNELLISLDIVHETIHKITNIIESYSQLNQFKEFYALKFLDNDNLVENLFKNTLCSNDYDKIREIRNNLFKDLKKDITEWIYSITKGIEREIIKDFSKKKSSYTIITDFLDLITLDKKWGIISFTIVVFFIFYLTFNIGDKLISLLEIILNYISVFTNKITNPILNSIINNGILAGVGNVILLMPYIFIMFLLISFLEDSGYMARVAFIMDRFMHKIGLHGKSFIPILLGFGCNVPAIMSTRTLESKSDRIKTIFIIPFIPCSGRLPVFILFTTAFFGKYAFLLIISLYLLAIILSLFTIFIIDKLFIKEKSEGLIMELPPYRKPHPSNVFLNTWIHVKEYLIKAGTIIFISSIIIWFFSYFPNPDDFGGVTSYIGIFGKKLEFLTKPLGFDWKMNIALITGFVAKENVISTLSILYSSPNDLFNTIKGFMDIKTALVYLIFILIYSPCLATISVIKIESKSWKITFISIIYSLLLAWIFSFVIKSFLSILF